MRGISKRGQEMSISTLVLIVLAIIVLVIVVIGFTGGWSNLWDRITNLGGGKANVGLVVQACQIACDTNSKYDYCSQSRKVVFDDKTSVMATCQTLMVGHDAGCYSSTGGSVTARDEAECKKDSSTNVWYPSKINAGIVTSCDKFTC